MKKPLSTQCICIYILIEAEVGALTKAETETAPKVAEIGQETGTMTGITDLQVIQETQQMAKFTTM